MTKFEKIIEGGPEVLAKMFADSKILFAVKALEEVGIDYELQDEAREKLFRLHYEYLTSEHVEKENSTYGK